MTKKKAEKKEELYPLELTTWERIVLQNLVGSNAKDLPLAQVKVGLDLLDHLELTPEEKEGIKYQEPLPGQMLWDEQGQVWVLDLPKAEATFLTTVALHKDTRGWPLDEKVPELAEKLKEYKEIVSFVED